MKRIMVVLAMTAAMVSCTSKSGHKLDGTHRVRAHEMVFDTAGVFTGLDIRVKAITIDTIYHSKDTVGIYVGSEKITYVID